MDQLRAFFEELALEWDGQQPPDRVEILTRLLMPFDDCFSGMALDVGTGTGALIPILWERYPGCRIVSLDLATEMLRRARRRCPQADLTQADVHTLPFRTGAFQTVVCHNSFPHFWRKQDALRELRRVIVPGGILLILHDLGREEVNAVHQSARSSIIHQDLLPTAVELTKYLEEAGFSQDCLEDCADHFVVSAEAV